MINKDRIVPITRSDLLTMYGTVLKLASISASVVAASDVDGNFTVTGSGDVGNVLLDQPLVELNFASGVTAAVVYFVADPDYIGFKVNGTAVTPSGAAPVKDSAALYTATLSGGGVAIAAISPIAS